MFTAPSGTVPNADTIKKALEYSDSEYLELTKLDDYYNGQHSEILKREKKNGLKNNKIVVNHAKYITDINVGYLLGNPIEYQATEDGVNFDLILEEYKKQTIRNEDHEIANMASIFGRANEITYALEDNSVRSKPIDPRNCVIVYDDTTEHEVLFAITFGRVFTSGETKYVNVKTYTKTQIQYWNEKIDAIMQVDAHSFDDVPIIEYLNNSDARGDFQQVISLMDAYNLIQSDRVNDREQLVEAILLFYGMKLTPEQKEDLREHRMLSIPKTQGDGAKVEYLVKTIQETEADVLRAKIEADIHKISMTPNLSDENFVGNASGVAIRYKLLAFEQSVINKERYFEKGLMKRFKLYNNYLRLLKQMPEIQTYQVDAVFKRNLPSNDLETSQIINNLRGIVDDETLVGQLSFVDDAAASIKQAAQESVDRATALAEQFGTNQPSENNPDEEQQN